MNINEIISLAEHYGFKCQVINQAVYIYTKYDEFYFRIPDIAEKNIRLYHRNKMKNINKYHLHRSYLDIPYMLRSIAEHDEFKITPNRRRKSRLELAFEQINNEKLNRNKSKKNKYIS